MSNRSPPLSGTSTPFIQESRCVVGLNKGEAPLQAKVNDILTKAKKSGELNALVKKWLNVPLPDKLANAYE